MSFELKRPCVQRFWRDILPRPLASQVAYRAAKVRPLKQHSAALLTAGDLVFPDHGIAEAGRAARATDFAGIASRNRRPRLSCSCSKDVAPVGLPVRFGIHSDFSMSEGSGSGDRSPRYRIRMNILNHAAPLVVRVRRTAQERQNRDPIDRLRTEFAERRDFASPVWRFRSAQKKALGDFGSRGG